MVEFASSIISWIPSVGGVRKLIMNEAHTSRYSIHPGTNKMYYDLRDLYWWSGMKRDIVEYVSRCLTCTKIKAEHQKPSGLLQQLEILEWKWEKIIMELVTKLPRSSSGYDAIWVIVDRLTKSAHFLTISEDYKTEKLARIYINEIVTRHETTEKIIQIKERLKTARSRQKSYADKRRKPIEFKVGDRVLLKVSPWKGVAMKMEHYLSHTDYPIWQVIQNGNGPISVTTDTNGMNKVLPPKTTEEVVAREKERKARTTLLMALPEDHLAKFHKMDDAKEIFDDLYNNLRVFERDVKVTTASSSSNTQNVAFVSADSTSSTNDTNDDDLKEMDLKWQVAIIFMRIKKFHKRTCRKLQFDTRDTVGFDKTKVECFNCHKIGHFSRDCRAKWNQDSRRRDGGYNGNKARDNSRRLASQDDSKALVTIDEEAIDWSGHVKEDTQNFAMMAYSSSNSGSDNEPSVDESDSKPSEYASCESDSSIETTTSMPEPVDNAQKIVCEPKVWTDAPISEEYESDSDDDSVSNVQENIEKLSFAFTDSVKHVKSLRENVKETCTPNHYPKIEKQHRHSHTRKGLGYAFTSKSCFVCGSFSHLTRDCDFHEKRMAKQAALTKCQEKGTGQQAYRPVWNNVKRVNYQNKFVPSVLLTKTGKIPVNTVRQNFSRQAASTSTASKVNTARPFDTVVKASAGCSWRNKRNPWNKVFNYNSGSKFRKSVKDLLGRLKSEMDWVPKRN
nr:reverse transcriptase domain-containing protein [Tanacetum cinerariifolium]